MVGQLDLQRVGALHAALLERVDPSARGKELEERVRRALRVLLNERGETWDAAIEQAVLDEALALGPLTHVLRDKSVREVMVVGPDQIWVERNGRIQSIATCFSSEQALRRVAQRIVDPLGRQIDEGSPVVDGRLPDGSRVHAVIPPISLVGTCITIRRFPETALTAHDLLASGSLTEEALDFLRQSVFERANIIVSGGTGSGKTTLLNVLSALIPGGERIVTIEDAAELRLHQAHVVTLEARPPNAEGRGAVTIRDLVKASLRMRPDRIIVGECRSGEALDMLQAMNTGHDGSLTTLHANSPADALSRLEVLALMAGVDLPLNALRRQIAGAVDLIIQIERDRRGHRRVCAISEVAGLRDGNLVLDPLFVHDGRTLRASGLAARCLQGRAA